MRPFHFRWFATLTLFALLPTAHQAQELPAQAPGVGLETQGSVTVGYRFTEFQGREQKFLELFDLQKGFRVMDFNVFGRAKEGTSPFADTYSLTASGLGGDPFPGGQLTVRKTGLYDLRVSYRQSHYYWDRNDDAVMPTGLRGLTTNHDWATVRRHGSANLLLHASNNLRFSFEYYRNSRDGVNFNTRSLDYFGAPGAWGAFARANPYYVEAPLSEIANRFTGGVSYSLKRWSLHYKLGYQTFEQGLTWNNVVSPQRSINVDAAATASEQLRNASWSEFRRLKTPVSEVSYTGKPNPRIDLRGSYIFFRYRGPANMDAAFEGDARTTSAGTTFAPYTVSLNARAHLSEPSHIIDQGFSLKLKEWWNVHTDYRYARFTLDSEGVYHTLRDSTTPFDEETEHVWRQGQHQMDFSMEFVPGRSLVVRPGIRLLKRDTILLADGVADPGHTRRVNTAWPLASVYYQPSKIFSVRADIQSITNGASYTRITPHTDVGGRSVIHFRPTEKVSVENHMIVRERKFRDTDFVNRLRSNAASISYALSDNFSVFGGFSYESFFATASVTFIRGTPPLKTTWRDQTVNRVWQAGLSTKPHRRLGLSLAGNFVRSTGAGEISGEPPIFGPMTWPLATGTIYYDFAKLGRLSVDLQRTYYLEEIVRGNDFRANLLTIRWTRDF